MDKSINYILLTGPPGVGKTTLISQVCDKLMSNHKIKCNGFFTQEVRNTYNERIGFDVITLNGSKGTLARTNPMDNIKRIMVGKYAVYVQEFENLVLPLLYKPSDGHDILVIDEIGKMELTSEKFCSALNDCMVSGTLIFGTIPLKKQQSTLSLVEKLRSSDKTKLFMVTKANRNNLAPEIINVILNSFKCHSILSRA